MTRLPTAAAKQPHGEVMMVSPELAQKWLEGNVHNRRVQDSWVDELEQRIKNGEWKVTHQGIAFTGERPGEGTLSDGQHRLYAIWHSGITVRVMVSCNVSLDSQDVIDDMRNRKPQDAIDLADKDHGREHTTRGAAILRAMLMGAGKKKMSTAAYKSKWEAHREAIQFAIACFTTYSPTYFGAPVPGVIARAWYTAVRADVAEFVKVLEVGRCVVQREEIVLLLRDWLISTRGRGGGYIRASAKYGKCERALYGYLKNQKVTRLFEPTDELFPLPEEIEELKAKDVRVHIPINRKSGKNVRTRFARPDLQRVVRGGRRERKSGAPVPKLKK